MAQTEAQLRASKKYHQKYVYLQARVSPEEKEAVTAHAAAIGESLNTFMHRAFAETMERDNASRESSPK
jgi:predicted HicB family RNase H-like nuclease